jgi:hypothetical protein
MLTPLSLTFVLVIFSSISFASLGQNMSSIQVDARGIRAKIKKLSSQKLFQVYLMTCEMNEIRQYVDHQGVVFAVTWRGLNHPDLSNLLGDFFKDYSAADAEVSGSRAQSVKRISTEQFVVEKSGHMGALRGKAYLPSSVPAGVRIDSLN